MRKPVKEIISWRKLEQGLVKSLPLAALDKSEFSDKEFSVHACFHKS
jgi:hypothetical protein